MSLFVNGDVAGFRTLYLNPALASLPISITLADADVLRLIQAAEAAISRRLGVFLEPTKVFPGREPTADEITALDGKPWAEEPGYDYEPDMFQSEHWGRIDTRHQPIISVDSIEFSYPTPDTKVFVVPADWIRLDKKYGVIQLIPAGNIAAAPLGVWVMSVLGGGRNVPFMIKVLYTAGLKDVKTDTRWADLLDTIFKQAVVSLIEGAFLPASGSISADGLSESFGQQKLEDLRGVIDYRIDGPKGANGGLRVAIKGITAGFF